jgi:hypothetical protein
VPQCDLIVNKNEIVLFFSYFSLKFSSTFLNLMILWTDELTKTQIIYFFNEKTIYILKNSRFHGKYILNKTF